MKCQKEEKTNLADFVASCDGNQTLDTGVLTMTANH